MRFVTLAAVFLMSCATAVEDQNADWGDPPKDTGATAPVDTGSAVDSSSVPDSTVPPTEDSSTPEDSSTAPDTTVVIDTATPDTAIPDSTPAVDTAPLDTGTSTGTCMWCATGNCPIPLIDYSCLLNCLSDGFFDCHYDPAASMPCTCIP